ncbi:hypothetical protein ACN47E_009092 [Coniothyrium glycines]
MLHLATTLLTIFLALLTITAARPNLQRRGLPGAVYTCDEPNFRGNCQWSEPATRCAQQGPKGKGVESFGPDPGGFCTLYERFDCSGREIQTVRFPGIQSSIPDFGSFRCFMDDGTRARTVAPSTAAAGGAKGLVDPMADPRLAGGVGSMDRKENLEEISKMEADNFSHGLIGLKKGVYY